MRTTVTLREITRWGGTRALGSQKEENILSRPIMLSNRQTKMGFLGLKKKHVENKPH